MPQPLNHRPRKQRFTQPPSLRLQLVLAVNLILALGLGTLMVLDYRYEFQNLLREKQTALREEASTLLPGVLLLRRQGPGVIQSYIDAVCVRMQDAASPGHHIVVGWDGLLLQARAHGRASPEILEAIKAAIAEEGGPHPGDEELIVGASRSHGVTVYVSEHISNLRSLLRFQLLWRVGGLLVVGMLGMAVMNLILLRLVSRPLQRLVATVRQIRDGRLGAQSGSFNSEELNFLAGEINAMSRSLAKTDRERQLQLAKARRIQAHLHPDHGPVPGLTLRVLHESATEVAGDYYDLLPLADGSWLIALADVTGHGVPAAMGAANLKVLLMTAAEHLSDPGQILRSINDRFCHVTLPEDFASLLLLRWDPQNSSLTYASAGHETGYMLGIDGTKQLLTSTGPLLGIGDGMAWESREVRVRDDDRLLLYTDGVTEAMSDAGEYFGRKRLAELFDRIRPRSLHKALEEVHRDLRDHLGESRNQDDLTLIVMEFQPLVSHHPQLPTTADPATAGILHRIGNTV